MFDKAVLNVIMRRFIINSYNNTSDENEHYEDAISNIEQLIFFQRFFLFIHYNDKNYTF